MKSMALNVLWHTFDEAVQGILQYFVENQRDTRVIYFDGWRGFGASAVLRAVADELTYRGACPELRIDKVIHIDCSTWKSRRAMQRAIAVELKLDASVIEMIDNADEEDDFKGVDESSRSEITSVAEVIDQVIKDHISMIVFHNGSGDYIDLVSFGLAPFRRYFMLWTFRKRFQGSEHYSEIEDKVKNTHFFAYETQYDITRGDILFPVLQKEATAIAANYPCMRVIDPDRITHCCLYGLFLYLCLPKHLENEWAARASIYWMCDGIIQGDQAWEISTALSKEIKWDLQPSLQDEVRREFIESSLKNSVSIQRFKSKYFVGQKFYPWITITALHNINPETLQDIQAKNTKVSSYFLAPERSIDVTLVLSDGLFDQWTNLQVLQLSYCDFSFASPPFIGCQNLRCLGLDHCKDKEQTSKQSDLRKWLFLHSLLVLDLIDTSWDQVFSEDIADLFINLRELNIIGVDCSHIWGQLQNKMEYVDLCGKKNIKLPSTLRFFRLDNHQPTPQSTPGIELSLKGCMGLESLFLRRISNLTELDLSGTAIRILDFTTMVVRVSGLKRLFLLGCEQLCIIKWGKNGTNVTRDLELLCIDTRPKIKYPQLFVDKNKSLGRLSVHAVIVDTRIARSLWALIDERSSDVDMNIHVTSSTVYGEVQSEGTYKGSISQLSDHVNMQQQDLTSAGQYHDVLLSMVGDAPMQSFPLPPTTVLSRHFEIAQGSHNLESELDINSPIRTLAHLVSEKAQSLHVHDISTSTCMPGGRWWWIRWCRIERCPKIETVFPKEAWDFDRLETAWVSDLLMARCIWSKGPRGYGASFQNLQHLHLRSCPRLQFVLPVWLDSFPNLKTLHVIHCSNLHNIFVLDEDYPWEITTKIGVAFPKLTTIHLHDLPMLRQICDVEFKMVAPALETIKIRGCWGLRRLPTVAADGPKPAVEIEKDVWDALEWDGVEANHHPSLFQAPVHSRYYKKKLPRGSVLW